MFFYWWALLLVPLLLPHSECKSDTTAHPVIPKHLLDCYMDDGIYHRDNRFTSTLEVFIDLLRKVESSPTARNLNARELSMVLLHYLKLDGIQSLKSAWKSPPNNVLPFAPSGDEYFKHRLTLVGLVAKIDQGYMAAFNESLTLKEMCNLHFMLSYSIDPYKREDESCTSIFSDGPEKKSDWNPYQSINGYYGRHKRKAEKEREQSLKESTEKRKERRVMKKRTLRDLRRSSKIETKQNEHNVREAERRRRSAANEKAEVEAVPIEQMRGKEKGAQTNDKFTIGNQELLSEGEFNRPSRGMQSLIQSRQGNRYGGRSMPRTAYQMDGNGYASIIPGIPLSECPAVNGAMKTPYGSLAIGTVIAGIAAGLNPEEIPPTKLNVDPAELESMLDKLNNTWATTLAGTVADTLTSPALLNMYNLRVSEGGWNDTTEAKWYLLKNNQFNYLTEVALRGSLDGLFLGASAKDWTKRFPLTKLSQMLQAYYGGYWGAVGAKNRVQMRQVYAPDEIFRKQLYLMSVVLKRQKTNVLTVLDYGSMTRDAVYKVTQYIQSMDDSERSSILPLQSTRDIFVNLVAFIDSSWGHENLLKIFNVLREAQVAATPQQSNLTVFCGNDGRLLMQVQNLPDLQSRFTKDALIQNCSRGMNLPLIFDTIHINYRKIYHEEKMSNKVNTHSQVVLLVPYDSPLPEHMEVASEKSRNFRQTFPDVRVMVAANVHKDGYANLVKDQKDVFSIEFPIHDQTMRTTKELAEGIKKGYQRISRPSCGSYFDDHSDGGEVKVIRDVRPGDISFYRLLPQYFFTQKGDITISIRSRYRAPLTICHSRQVDRLVGPTPRENDVPKYEPNYNSKWDSNYPTDPNQSERQMTSEDDVVVCKEITTETHRIVMSNPCEGISSVEDCLPLYISFYKQPSETVSIICPTCRLPTNVEFELTAVGLQCYNSAAAVFLSPIAILLLILGIAFNAR